MESVSDSVNVSHCKTGTKFELKEVTCTVVEVLEPTSTDGDMMESDNFAEITTERSHKGENKGSYLESDQVSK